MDGFDAFRTRKMEAKDPNTQPNAIKKASSFPRSKALYHKLFMRTLVMLLPSLQRLIVPLLLFTHLSFTHSLATASDSCKMKNILVTGGNSGIGKAICERLLKNWPDTYVIMGSRDSGRGEEAVKDIMDSLKEAKDRLELVVIDVSSDESVKEAAKKISESKAKSLYGIINNAGIGWDHSIRETINTNYYGPQRVNDAFWSMLQSPGGRIVHVGSGAGPNYVKSCKDEHTKNMLSKPWKYFKSGDIQAVNDLAEKIISQEDPKNAYGASKALLHAYTVVLGKSTKDILVNACSPGLIKTKLISGYIDGGKSPEEGAIPPCWLMMDEDFIPEQPNGRFYGSDCVRSPLDVPRSPGDPPYKSDEDVTAMSTTVDTAGSQ